MTTIRKSDPLSLFKEEIVLDELDAQSRCDKYRRQYDMALSREEYERAEKIQELLLFVERPWEYEEENAVPNAIRYTPEQLMEMYGEMFPDELKQDK